MKSLDHLCKLRENEELPDVKQKKFISTRGRINPFHRTSTVDLSLVGLLEKLDGLFSNDLCWFHPEKFQAKPNEEDVTGLPPTYSKSEMVSRPRDFLTGT
ncbi:hypothetical protein CEXT_484571 [Caerostris extrusa]|uniref:Uncharacterized protein n=1 Tax=Caerostris extrusa TaxID=172846 RepID=A0AAV4UZE6_CAEEX|nr:hypothetical protein CEXT_484571 [Caerostris extrusa]